MSTLLEQGPRYLDLGWPVIPIASKAKMPPLGFSWERYQTSLPTRDDLREWASRYPNAGVAIVTGKLSSLCVIDIDGEEGRQSINGILKPDGSPIVQTSRGWHVYYRHPETAIGNAVGILPGVDIRCDGGYVIAPDSKHISDSVYTWSVEPSGLPLPLLPEKIWQLLLNKNLKPLAHNKAARSGIILSGTRNDSLFRAACGFARSSRTFDFLVTRVMALNQKRCEVPLDAWEVLRICENACRSAGRINLLSSISLTSSKAGCKQRLTPVL
jgi:hypothetical protein